MVNRLIHKDCALACGRPADPCRSRRRAQEPRRIAAAIEERWPTGDRHPSQARTAIDDRQRRQDDRRALLAEVEAGHRPAALRRLKAHILDAGRALARLIEAGERGGGGESTSSQGGMAAKLHINFY